MNTTNLTARHRTIRLRSFCPLSLAIATYMPNNCFRRWSLVTATAMLFVLLQGTAVADDKSSAALETARLDYKTGFTIRARKQCSEISRRDPTNLDAQWLEALCFAASGEFAQALKRCRELEKRRTASNLDRIEQPISVFRLCGDYASSLKLNDQALELKPTAALWKERALTNFSARNYRECIRSCDQSLKLTDSPEVRKLKARGLTAQGKFSESERLYANLLRDFPKELACYPKHATSLWILGRREEAPAVFQNATETMRNRPDFLCMYISWLQQHYLSAEDPLRRLNECTVDNPSTMRDIANILRVSGKLKEAEEWYSRTIKIDPRNITNYIFKSLFFVEKKDLEAANAVLEDARANCGESFQLEIARLSILLKSKPQLIDDELDRLVNTKLRTGDDYAMRAAFLSTQQSNERRLKQQIFDLEKACEIGATADYYASLMSVKVRLARLREAVHEGIDRCRQLVLAAPTPDNYTFAAGTVDHFGDPRLAEQYLKTALELAPEHMHAHTGIGRLYLFTHRFAEAIPYLTKATEESPPEYDDPPILLAEAFYLTSRPEEAQRILKELKQRTGRTVNLADIRDRCARFYSNPLEALRALLTSGRKTIDDQIAVVKKELLPFDSNKIQHQAKNNDAIVLRKQLADLLFLRGDFRGALVECDKLIEGGSDSYSTLSRKAALYYAMKDHKLARRWRKAALEKYMERKSTI